MTRRSAVAGAVTLLVLSLGVACSNDAPVASNVVPPAAVEQERVVFVALGGDETLNRGIDDSLRRAWTQRVFVGLPRSAVYVNIASEDATAGQGLQSQVPKALELRPTIATVWFGSGDARDEHRTEPDAFARNLTQIVQQLQSGGVAHVLLLSRTSPAAGSGSRYVDQVKQVAQQTGVAFVEVPGAATFDGGATTQDAIAAAVKTALTP